MQPTKCSYEIPTNCQKPAKKVIVLRGCEVPDEVPFKADLELPYCKHHADEVAQSYREMMADEVEMHDIESYEGMGA